MTYVISNIHGDYDKFKAMLEKINFSDRDVMYILGDIVDYGEKSMELIGDISVRYNVLPILGEHDLKAVKLLSALDTMLREGEMPDAETLGEMTEWIAEGGQKTMEDFKALDGEMREGVLDYLSDMTLYEEVEVEVPVTDEDGNPVVDDEGNPVYVVQCLKPRVGLFGAKDVNEAILFNPCTGESEIYPLKDVPEWVDTVFDGDLATEKYNWYGMLSGGYFNSVFAKVGCKQTTDDYGYITIGDDVWYFTGVTSVTADESNIGFIISNARTGQYIYYSVAGAEEYSAMNAAQGQVQNMGYNASFPSLVNISGEATYIMVLKDNNGYVKQFALVNVENVNIVAIGDTQSSAIANYRELLVANGVVEIPEDVTSDLVPENSVKTAEITVLAVRDVVIGGETYVYITADDGAAYKCKVADNESVILVGVGAKLSVDYIDTDVESIKSIQKFEIK